MKKRIIFKGIVSNFIRLISLLIAVSIISFSLVSLSPIDPVQAYVGAGTAVSPEQRANIEETWGLGQPPVERFTSWGSSILKGDFGISLIYRKDVLSIIKEKFKVSLGLMAVAWVLSGLIGYILGIIMALYNGSKIDKIIRSICLALLSTPGFWLGLLILMIFSVYLGWFPIGLSTPIGQAAENVGLGKKIHHTILPAITLSLSSFGETALHSREKMIEVLQSDFVLFAKARGKKDWEIIREHGLRNTLIPFATLQFSSFSELFAGSILVEQIFSYPGLGQAAVQAGIKSDIPLLLGITIFSSLFVFIGNSLANLTYSFVDPKIREASYD